MPCWGPLTAYRSRDIDPVTGNRPLVFDVRLAISDAPIRLPCGQCSGCRLERSRQWAMRCLHEARMHRENCFVTLTYNDGHLPVTDAGHPTLVKRDMQLFMKRLRFACGAGIRFYGCGEYGPATLRPHYHLILFNIDFHDRVTFRAVSSKNRFPVFSSQSLQMLWSDKDGLPIGRAIVGDVSFDSAAYVARYVMKKINGDMSYEHYYGREPEFTNMSRRPGIGMSWYEKYGRETYNNDSVIVNGRPVRPPRYYDTKFELTDRAELMYLKAVRRRKALAFAGDNTSRRRRVKELVLADALKRKTRTL